MIQGNDFGRILRKLTASKNLTNEEAAASMSEIMSGNVTPCQVASFLTALKMKGESADEITAFAKVMRQNAIKVSTALPVVDTCGTGGDGLGTFNVSTCSAFVAAGAGAPIAKHGNRKASGACGSSDVLEKLGVKVVQSSAEAEGQLSKFGITFMFAPAFHPAMKNVASVRNELGFKTVFNVLGPLCNPAGAKRQVIGVYEKKMLSKVANALVSLGTEKAFVVSSDTDEISISSKTSIIEVNGRSLKEYGVSPEGFGIKKSAIGLIKASNADESAEKIIEVLSGKKGPARDIVLLNSGAAIYVSGLAASLGEGILLAAKSIDSGSAMKKLDALKSFGGKP